ncbi:hypothetical protein GRX03_12840 [Halovenus sp. WSH3]|uniref:DUF4878 domain-containing protein n=1 Tax=Halovenus carboxidivorans TaxID=2692199 RepID=A0A6B0TH14_9EURY|nr:hypothetical protein [Halovenus carboxidivorans]MXR52489.1 hypothetical protein [Halovenus carboxidivorans]
MRRRRYLGAAAGVALSALAGCFGGSETNSPRSVVRAYLEAEHDGDAGAMADLLHSASPLDPTAGDTEIEQRSLQIDEILVEARNLSRERIASLDMRLPEETISAIADRENALVDAAYEAEPPETDGGGETVSGRVAVENTYLTATEDGKWFVVAFEVV